MSNHILGINTILHTKDGSKVGNAIVTGREGEYWILKTDYGNTVKFTPEEIEECFNIAWGNFSKTRDGYSCKEMQEMMASTHKHRAEPKEFYCFTSDETNSKPCDKWCGYECCQQKK